MSYFSTIGVSTIGVSTLYILVLLRRMMRTLVQIVFGLFVLKAVVAGPRFSRQADLDSYDNGNYDVDLEDLNMENQDMYDYEDELTNGDPEVRNPPIPSRLPSPEIYWWFLLEGMGYRCPAFTLTHQHDKHADARSGTNHRIDGLSEVTRFTERGPTCR